MKTHVVLFLSCCLLQGALSADLEKMDQKIQSLEENVQLLENSVKDIASMVRSILTEKLQVSPPATQREEPRQNTTVEERLTLVETQVSDLGNDLEAVEDEVTVVFAQQLIQDGRLLELETDIDGFDDSIDSLFSTDVSLDQRLQDQEDSIESLFSTDVSLDQRLQAQEVSGTIAFQADIGNYTAIPIESVVLFSIVDVNLGNGFNISMGEFRVPSGGSGLYYFRFGYLSNYQLFSDFQIRKNGARICRAYTDIDSSGIDDLENSSCAVVVTLVEGDVIDVFYASGTSDRPVVDNIFPDNTFTGFRISPQ